MLQYGYDFNENSIYFIIDINMVVCFIVISFSDLGENRI